MTTNDIDYQTLYEVFFNFVVRNGLSPMEALSYGLTRTMGHTSKEASNIINNITGKKVTNRQVSVYTYRGLVKIMKVLE